MRETSCITSNAAFRTLIVEPSEAVFNKGLLRVDYWLLEIEQPEFRLEAPNQSGLCAVRMVFEDGKLELFPAWDKRLRGANAYHIQARIASEDTERGWLTEARSLNHTPHG
jgi:hypothetical protein